MKKYGKDLIKWGRSIADESKSDENICNLSSSTTSSQS